MKLANLHGRAALAVADGFIDVEEASAGQFGPGLAAVYERWEAFRDWAANVDTAGANTRPAGTDELGAPSPEPRQVFALALNYRDHAEESGLERPPAPAVFTKFPTCITGPTGEIVMPTMQVDWEVELVVVIGREASSVTAADAWGYVAGFTVGQDVTERGIQFVPPIPQFGLSKSFRHFGPTGPLLVTLDEIDGPDDLGIGCSVNGEDVQKGRTSNLIFTIPEVIEYVSRIVALLPGDLIFTGTPAGIGATRQPPRFLQPGDELESSIDQIGTMRHVFVAAPDPS